MECEVLRPFSIFSRQVKFARLIWPTSINVIIETMPTSRDLRPLTNEQEVLLRHDLSVANY